MRHKRQWAVVVVLVALTALVGVVVPVASSSSDRAVAAPANKECKAAKGTIELTPNGDGAYDGAIGTISGAIDGTFTAETTLFAADDEWGPRVQSMLEVVPKSGPAIHLTMQQMGTNWTSQKVVGGGWIQGGRSGADYYLSTMIRVGPNYPTQVWDYAGLVCTGQN